MPITPIPEKPPIKLPKNSIDWTEALAALTAQPGEWFKVDGPCKSNATQGRERSLTRFAEAAGVTVEVTHRTVDGAHWVYARTVEVQPEQPAPQPAAPKADPKPVAAVPDPPAPGVDDDETDATHPHHCDLCGDRFRTNSRHRQHQANAHKAS